MSDLSYKAKIRLYYPRHLSVKNSIKLEKKQVHYLINVMRKKIDDSILVFNSFNGEFLAKISEISKNTIIVDIIKKIRDVKIENDIWLLFAPVKKSPTEYIVQKATELGVSKIIPIITERTITKNLNLNRMQDIAIESSEQCDRITIPEICAVKKLKDLILNWDNDRIIFFCDETIRNNDVVKIDFQNLSTKSFGAILVGPEGGFSANETNYLREKKFIRPIDLGPRILRSDTAVIAALSLWHCLNGDIKSN
jgi:16S rRNA (uracil1498-N3)-methyltransferase